MKEKQRQLKKERQTETGPQEVQGSTLLHVGDSLLEPLDSTSNTNKENRSAADTSFNLALDKDRDTEAVEENGSDWSSEEEDVRQFCESVSQD